MSDAAGAASVSSAPTNAPPPSASEALTGKDTHDWVRPAAPKTEQPKAETKERTTPAAKPKEPPPKSDVKKTEPEKVAPVDDDPEFEIDGEDGAKQKVKRSALLEAYKRKAEIEKAAHAKFQSAADTRKEIAAKQAELAALWQGMEQDPWALHRARLVQGGMSEADAEAKITELAEARLVQQMQRARMTPEQIQAEQDRQELERLRAEKTQTEEEATKARHNELKSKHREQWDRTIAEAMTTANLAKTRATAARVARVLADHMDPVTGKSIDPVLAARIARDQHHGEIRHELGELLKSDPRAAIELIGPDVVKQIIALKAKEHQDFEPQRRKDPPSSQPKPASKTPPPTLEEAREKLGIRRY